MSNWDRGCLQLDMRRGNIEPRHHKTSRNLNRGLGEWCVANECACKNLHTGVEVRRPHDVVYVLSLFLLNIAADIPDH